MREDNCCLNLLISLVDSLYSNLFAVGGSINFELDLCRSKKTIFSD